MNVRTGLAAVAAVILVGAWGCGDNTAPQAVPFTLNPPTGLQAYSAGAQKVNLQWTAAVGSDSTEFRGYLVQWGTKSDTVGPRTLTYAVDSLPSGPTIFSVASRSRTGGVSSASVLTWAPAARFDIPFTLLEYNNANKDLNVGIHLGSRLTDPATLAVGNLQAAGSMDMFLWGDAGQPLRLRSASLYVGTWNMTLFSTQVDSGNSLNTYLPAFPALITFTQTDLVVKDNMICYARVNGEFGEINYVRFLIHLVPNLSYPDRAVLISVSLQRIPGVVYAALPTCRPAKS